MFNSPVFWLIVSAVDVVLAAGVTLHAVLWKRDSRAVIGWVGLAWLAPFLGAALYLFLGINRIERKAVSLKLSESWKLGDRLSNRLKLPTDCLEAMPDLTGLMHAGGEISGMPLTAGNRVEPLIDGDEAYPAMIQAINDAQQSVTLLSYIFDSDKAGEQFQQALLAAQQRGIEVRVLIDDVGSKYSRPNMVQQLKDLGLPVASFLPTRIPFPIYANLRNHRKILVVDGQIGFTGGTNIREGHCLKWDPEEPVQCLHFRLEGPVVTQLQRMFAVDWAFAAEETLSGPVWFCESTDDGLFADGSVWARGVEHGPDEHFEKMPDLIAAALASARHRVRIVTPYFLPNASLIQALNVTAMRGVEVDIYLPAHCNIKLVQWAATAQLWQMLEKGCRIHYTADPFDHTKLMIVDSAWTLIGSTNWDPRSLRLNFEFNVECYDRGFAEQLDAIVDGKAATSREITLDEINGRSFWIRLRDGLARLLTPYL